MTKLQQQRARAKAVREKIRAKRLAAKARELVRKQKRQAKREVRLAPKRALAQWSLDVRAAAGNKCEVCGKGPPEVQVQAHHLLPRERYHEYRTALVNGCCLCSSHHKWSKFSAHRNPIWFSGWLRLHRPITYIWVKRHMGRWQDENRTSVS